MDEGKFYKLKKSYFTFWNYNFYLFYVLKKENEMQSNVIHLYITVYRYRYDKQNTDISMVAYNSSKCKYKQNVEVDETWKVSSKCFEHSLHWSRHQDKYKNFARMWRENNWRFISIYALISKPSLQNFQGQSKGHIF